MYSRGELAALEFYHFPFSQNDLPTKKLPKKSLVKWNPKGSKKLFPLLNIMFPLLTKWHYHFQRKLCFHFWIVRRHLPKRSINSEPRNLICPWCQELRDAPHPRCWSASNAERELSSKSIHPPLLIFICLVISHLKIIKSVKYDSQGSSASTSSTCNPEKSNTRSVRCKSIFHPQKRKCVQQ